MTDTSHDETVSERTISQTEHLFVVRAHANRQRGVSLLNRRLRLQKDSLAEMQEDILNVSEDLAEKNWCLRKAEEDVGSLQVQLAAAHDVAKELNASNERLLERAETAERRLQQATDGETDEEVQRLRGLVDKAYQQAAARLAECDEAKRVVEVLRKRAQKAEQELSTVKMQHEKDRTALAGFREANGEMGRQMEADQQRIRHFEQVIDGLRAEVSHSTVEAPDAVA